jgi:hypothetical protein
MRMELGKIRKIKIGPGGYQDAMFGITFELGNSGWGVIDFWGSWETRSEHATFSEEDWRKTHLESYFRLMKLMKDAQVTDAMDLVGTPVEVTFNGMSLASWRVLTEVI